MEENPHGWTSVCSCGLKEGAADEESPLTLVARLFFPLNSDRRKTLITVASLQSAAAAAAANSSRSPQSPI